MPGEIIKDVDWHEVDDNISSDYTIIELNKIGIILDDPDTHKTILKRKPKIIVKSKYTDSEAEEKDCISNKVNQLKTDGEDVCRLSLADGLSIKYRNSSDSPVFINEIPVDEYLSISYELDGVFLKLAEFISKKGEYKIDCNVEDGDKYLKIILKIPDVLTPTDNKDFKVSELRHYMIPRCHSISIEGTDRVIEYLIPYIIDECISLRTKDKSDRPLYWNGSRIVTINESDEGPIGFGKNRVIYKNKQIDVTLEVLRERTNNSGNIPKTYIKGIFGEVFHGDQVDKIINILLEQGIIIKQQNGKIYVKSQ